MTVSLPTLIKRLPDRGICIRQERSCCISSTCWLLMCTSASTPSSLAQPGQPLTSVSVPSDVRPLTRSRSHHLLEGDLSPQQMTRGQRTQMRSTGHGCNHCPPRHKFTQALFNTSLSGCAKQMKGYDAFSRKPGKSVSFHFSAKQLQS